MVSSPIISFQNATLLFHNRVALEDITLDIQEGELIGVIGPNGSGKTTLLRAILGLMLPQRGTIRIFDCRCDELRCHHRVKIGYLPQKELVDPDFPISVFEAVLMGRYSAIGLFRSPSSGDRRIAEHALEEVGISELAERPLGQLSGGQQQRVYIARALAQQPRVLLLDEPTTGLDVATQRTIIDLVKRLRDTLGLTIVLVTHDINMVSPISDRLLLLKTRLLAAGPPKSVLNQETLIQMYGKDVVITDRDYVIVGDHHRHQHS